MKRLRHFCLKLAVFSRFPKMRKIHQKALLTPMIFRILGPQNAESRAENIENEDFAKNAESRAEMLKN